MTGVLLIIAGFIIVLAWALWPLLPERVRHDTGSHVARPVNGRNLGTLPRIATPGHPPWITAGQPVLRPEPAPETDRYPAEQFLDGPVVPGFMRQGDWGTMPAERILAAELPQVIAL